MEKWLAALFLLLAGAREAVRSFERGAASDIRDRLQRPGTLDVKVKPKFALNGSLHSATFRGSDFSTIGSPFLTEPRYSQSARIDRLRLSMKDVNITGLDVRLLQAEIPDCRYDKTYGIKAKRIRLTRSGVGKGRVEITARAIAEFAMRKYDFITDFHISFHAGRFRAHGTIHFQNGRFPFGVEGELEAEDGSRLVIAKASFTISGRPATPELAQALLKRLNPVIDEDRDLRLLDTLYIRKLTLEEDVLTAEGDVKIPTAPEGGKQ